MKLTIIVLLIIVVVNWISKSRRLGEWQVSKFLAKFGLGIGFYGTYSLISFTEPPHPGAWPVLLWLSGFTLFLCIGILFDALEEIWRFLDRRKKELVYDSLKELYVSADLQGLEPQIPEELFEEAGAYDLSEAVSQLEVRHRKAGVKPLDFAPELPTDLLSREVMAAQTQVLEVLKSKITEQAACRYSEKLLLRHVETFNDRANKSAATKELASKESALRETAKLYRRKAEAYNLSGGRIQEQIEKLLAAKGDLEGKLEIIQLDLEVAGLLNAQPSLPTAVNSEKVDDQVKESVDKALDTVAAFFEVSSIPVTSRASLTQQQSGFKYE